MHWTWIIARSSGLVTWALATCVVAWGLLLRTRLLGRTYEGQRILTLHRFLSVATVGFLAVHLIALILDPVVKFSVPMVLIPGLASWKTLAVSLGVIAMWLMLPVTALGGWLMRNTKFAAVFRNMHYVAYAMWPFATAHYIMAGTDAMELWSLALLVTGTGALVFLLLSRGFVPLPPLAQRRTQPGASPLVVQSAGAVTDPQTSKP
jgi:sulfoxide reductase heme-binding subunit YedZ